MTKNKEKSYSKVFSVNVSPELVYKAITEQVDKWWTELSNKATKVGDKLLVQFEENTSWGITVSQVVLNQFLAWKVVEANHGLEILSTFDEWVGTEIEWEIKETEKGSKVIFKHNGLVPSLECYEVCENGWNYFLESLKEFLQTGEGKPFKK